MHLIATTLLTITILIDILDKVPPVSRNKEHLARLQLQHVRRTVSQEWKLEQVDALEVDLTEDARLFKWNANGIEVGGVGGREENPTFPVEGRQWSVCVIDRR